MIHLRSTLVMSTGVAVIIVGVVSSRKDMSAKVRLGLLEVLVRGEDDEGVVGGAVGGAVGTVGVVGIEVAGYDDIRLRIRLTARVIWITLEGCFKVF